ncbi:MAG: beta-propeller fold lactonase family protein [Methylocapsa sp.]|nr:beta-propeller fold lactonase family protein [Methylocapsa sp.]
MNAQRQAGWQLTGFVCIIAGLLICSPARGDEAFITEQTGDAVSVLDLSSKQVVAHIPVSGKPAGVAMAPDGKTAFVTSTEGKFVTLIDTDARTIRAQIAMPDTPLGIAADPSGRFVYVAGFYLPRLYKIDVAARTIAGSVEIGASPSGVAVTPDGALIVTADRDDNQISLIDAKSFTRIGTVKTGTHPFGVTIDEKGERAYTANVESDDISVIDLKSRKLLGTVPSGKRPYAVALAKGRGFATDQYGGTVSVFDLATLKPVKRISVGEYPEGIEASADGTKVYAVNWFSNDVWAIDSGTLNVTAKMPVGDGPRAFGIFLRKTPAAAGNLHNPSG